MTLAYRVIQRVGTTGNIAISGTSVMCWGHAEGSFNGGAWQTIGAVASDGTFTGTLTGQPQGQGAVQVRIAESPDVSAVVGNVGIGDNFIIAGQSNAMGCATNHQTYSHPTLKACMYTKAGAWAEAADPLDGPPGTSEYIALENNCNFGSVWLPMATHAMASLGVPVGLVPCARDALKISFWERNESNHFNTESLFGPMANRARRTGAKAMLWWQGESDGLFDTTQSDYRDRLRLHGDHVFEDLGIPVIACKFLDCSGLTTLQKTTIWDAIEEAWGTHHILPGPDLSDIPSDDPYHAKNDDTIAECASRWWDAIEAALYS